MCSINFILLNCQVTGLTLPSGETLPTDVVIAGVGQYYIVLHVHTYMYLYTIHIHIHILVYMCVHINSMYKYSL